jgi:hypothetical protein
MRTFTIWKETRLIITWNLLRRWKKNHQFFVIFLAKWFCTADYFFLDIWLNFYDLKWVERDFNIYKNNKTRVRFQVFFFFFCGYVIRNPFFTLDTFTSALISFSYSNNNDWLRLRLNKNLFWKDFVVRWW